MLHVSAVSGSGKAADSAAQKDAVKAEEMSASDPVKAASSTAKQVPADMEVEAGEVDAKGAHLLRPEAPEFKPGTDSAAAAAAATAAGPKRKETEHQSPAQVLPPDRQESADYA